MLARLAPLASALALATLFSAKSVAGAGPLIEIDTPMSPPAWALLERELLQANAAACAEFYARYYDERGFLRCVERWGGDDGPDDAMECCNDWPLIYMLGGPESVRTLYERAIEGHL